jgi:hypothetical protein
MTFCIKNDTVIPNSEWIYVVSANQVPSVELDLNDKSRVSGSENFEFGIAENDTAIASSKCIYSAPF